MTDIVLLEKTKQLLAKAPITGQDFDTKVQNLLEGEYLRRLARYRHTDFLLTLKYEMAFDEFVKQRVVRQKNYSWDSESDAMEWESAVSGMRTMERLLRELRKAEYVQNL